MDGGCTRVRWFCSLQHHRADGIKKRVSFKDPYRRCYRQVDSFLPSALTLQRYKYFLITNNKHREKMETTDNNKPASEQQPLVAKTILVEQQDLQQRHYRISQF